MCNCNQTPETMNTEDLKKLAIAGALLFGAYKFGPGWAKAGALAVAAGIVAKRVPYVKDVL
jgi:hypothetical protein